jgi:hypothetical protein
MFGLAGQSGEMNGGNAKEWEGTFRQLVRERCRERLTGVLPCYGRITIPAPTR